MACALGAVTSTQQSEQPQQKPPVFRGASDAVRVFATVTERDGRIATKLTQEDFEVRDEGKPQPITQFDNTPQPIRLVVMLDVSGTGLAAAEFSARLKSRGVLMNPTTERALRLVTHSDVSRQDCERAIEIIAEVAAGAAS